MKESPEFVLAKSLIGHLKTVDALGSAVLEDPFTRDDQAAKLAIAAQACGLAVAVLPGWPTLEQEPANTARVTRCTLAVAVLATTNLPGHDWAANLHAAVAQTLAAIMDSQHETSRGIPYAEPRLEDIADLDLSQLQGLQNLEGAIIRISKPVSYKQYYATSGVAAELSK